MIVNHVESETKIKHEFCAEVNCTNQYTRQVLVKKTNIEDHDEELFAVPLCQKHYENFHGQIELENSVQVVPTEFDQV